MQARQLVWLVLIAAGISTARAEFLYTVHLDETSLEFEGDTFPYPAQDFSFVTPALIGRAPGYLTSYDFGGEGPLVHGHPVGSIDFLTAVFTEQDQYQYIFRATVDSPNAFAEVDSLIWAFLTPGGMEEYGPGTYGHDCIRLGEPSDLCFVRILTGLAPDQAGRVGTGYMTVEVVPVPAAAWLLGSALGMLGWLRRRRAAI